MSFEEKLLDFTERLFKFWKLIVLFLVLLFLIVFFNISRNDRYYLSSKGLVIDKRTGKVYYWHDLIIKKEVNKGKDESRFIIEK